MKFAKMHNIGNDFIIINSLKREIKNPGDLARKLCRRNFSIGADGLVLVLPSKKADFKMRIFNSDGSEAETGGNELITFTKYVFDNRLVNKKKIKIETLAGISESEMFNGKIKVDMCFPILERDKIPMKGLKGKVINEPLKLKERTVKITALSVGNPHAVVFIGTFNFPIEKLGRQIEEHEAFPNRINVELVQIVNKREINQQQWERGTGVTLSTGGGACAAVVACVLNKKTDRKVLVHFIGGDMEVEWAKNNHIYITGRPEVICEGEFKF